jgi:sugar/nucleoside kinase (ribokinase family)
MDKKYDFTVPGSVCTVQVLKVHSMPVIGVSETVLNQKTADEIYLGGCSYNIWSVLSMLGASTYPVFSYRGDYCDKHMKSDCEKYDAPTDSLFLAKGDINYHCLMFQDDNGDHITISIPYGKDIDKESTFSGAVYTDKQFKDSRCVIFALVYDDEALELAKKHNLKIVYSYRNDPVLCGGERLWKILKESHIIFTNEVESKFITSHYGLESMTDFFKIANAEIIVTTLGKKGSVTYVKNDDLSVDKIFVPITHSPVGNVDSVGAGDGFVGGFMYGYVKDKSILTCAQYGSTVSSFVIEKEGSTTNLPTLEQMLERNASRPDAKNK